MYRVSILLPCMLHVLLQLPVSDQEGGRGTGGEEDLYLFPHEGRGQADTPRRYQVEAGSLDESR